MDACNSVYRDSLLDWIGHQLFLQASSLVCVTYTVAFVKHTEHCNVSLVQRQKGFEETFALTRMLRLLKGKKTIPHDVVSNKVH